MARWSRSDVRCRAIVAAWSLLDLLDLDEKRLELGRLGIGITHRRGQRIGEESRYGDADEAPMDRYADRVDNLAVDGQRTDAFGDHGNRLDVAAVRTHFDLLARGDAN